MATLTRQIFSIALFGIALSLVPGMGPFSDLLARDLLAQARAAGGGCTAKGCHAGIMDIVPPDLPMMKLILQNGLRHKDMDGCVVCHGGTPGATVKEKAHQGIPSTLERAPGPKAFYPDPGALQVAQNTCGVCHPGYVYRVERSLMNTEAGKIQGNLSTWGARQDLRVIWGNHDMDDPDGPVPSGTTLAYENYMAALRKACPGPFPDKLARLPLPSVQEIDAAPEKAAFIYQRTECQNCHLNIKGAQIPGNFRGAGCSACHLGYAPDGIYQGRDQSIPRTPGHIRTHRIAGNRKTGGIQISACQACHNRGKRIGTSFAGQMETPFEGPFDAQGQPRPLSHGKRYLSVQEDLHHRQESRPGNPRGGLLCQDCHTSMDVHGDGNLQGTTLAQVEIECTDCHGTPDRFPWELPLGHGDELPGQQPSASPRGVAQTRLLSSQQFGFDYDVRDGYLLSARGNPLGNVVRSGTRVLVHSASGKDFFVPVLKTLEQEEKTPAGQAAMSAVPAHLHRLECYTCHAAWTPQCYGCHIRMDFSDPARTRIDWVAVSRDPAQALSPSPRPGLAGDVRESAGYMRWETPVLGINGEGRVSPLMPGCQVAYTIIGSRGQVTALERMAPNPPEAGAAGQTQVPLALDMAPAQPHTSAARARPCESCHARPKTLGLGIDGGIFRTLEVPPHDWSRVVDEEGVQLVTVGSHWPGSRAFNKKEMEKILRTGTCLACHGEASLSGKMKGLDIQNPQSHAELMKKMLIRFREKTGRD